MERFNFCVPINKGSVVVPLKIEEEMTPGQKKTRYRFKGVASTTTLDRDHEVVSSNCIKSMVNSIKLKHLPIFGNHEHSWENMIGYADGAEVINNQLIVDIISDFEETNPKITHLVGKLEAGLPLSLSIGGKVTKDKRQFDKSLNKDVRVIDDVELLETSIVGIAANPDAYLTLGEQISKSLKMEGEQMSEEDISKASKEKEEPKEEKKEMKKADKEEAQDKEEEKKSVKKAEEKPEEDAEEKAYSQFKKFADRYSKENSMSKAEGVSGAVGSENADAKNSIKSATTFDMMKKAFKEEAVEVKAVKVDSGMEAREALSFANLRKNYLKK